MVSLSRIMRRFFKFSVLFSFFLSSCNIQNTPLIPLTPGWTYMDLLAMDPVDSPDSDLELVALYARHLGKDFQIRLDFLELKPETKFNLYLAIDTQIGGSRLFLDKQDSNMEWDILISIDSNENLETYLTRPALKADRLRVLRDPEEDTIIVVFSTNSTQNIVDARTSIMTWIKPPGGKDPVDSIGPVILSAPAPKQANVVLYFWNTFAAATPAQALRRWDGAHSGPDSARHGLNHLLNAVEATRMPVILSDLYTPQYLSALDYLGVLDRVRRLESNDLVSIPDISTIDLSEQPVFNVPDWVFEKSLSWMDLVRQQFMMPESEALVTRQWPQSLGFLPRYRIVIPEQIAPLSIARMCFYGQIRLFCQIERFRNSNLPTSPYLQVDEDGLTVDAKKELVDAALSDAGKILFLGGDFGRSAWGIQNFPTMAMEYLSNHPWIRVLSLTDLQSWTTYSDPGKLALPDVPDPGSPFIPESSSGQSILSGMSTEDIHAQVLDRLKTLPDNEVSAAIWQWYFGLLAANSKEQHRLNAATLGQIGHLLAGEKWAERPYSLADCRVDLDWDGENECVLSSERFFATFEPKGGSLVVGLLRDPQGLQQFVAPTYQIYNGISDPFLWKTDEGFAGDPDAIQGAFIERANRDACCVIGIVNSDSIEFEMKNMTMRKIYHLSDSFLEVYYQTSRTTIVSGMLVDNPWNRFFPQWSHLYPATSSSDETLYFNLGNIRVSSSAEMASSLFTSSKEYLSQPEDPNFDYTAGHHLLFPFGNFAVTGSGEFVIRVEWPKE